ncbi:hypothetical protein M2337_002745 [Sphingobium sp. B2D3A]|uniref:hypothetical protein n=1 Tax=unclassified Sphingobium TaxID=2611147 RepID=UPI00222416D1|nr:MULTISPECIES: hypothetical protein [unclassified Sphingobium]MCW2338512.1 hypothetical protein [Sphingobium sp. B2D3A]
MFKEITVLRVRKSKDGKELGDESVDQFCRRIARLKTDDYVFSAIGGNQYAIISTIKHERDFIVLDRHGNHSTAAEVVPHRALGSYIESGVRHSDGAVLRKIRAATQARLYHLSPPPPKSDNEFIRKFHETRFAAAGLGLLEPTDPAFRLACWKMQQESLSTLCADVNVKLLPPPDNAVTQDGYLGRAFYSKDVTHANRRYGEQVLRQILEVVHSRKDSGTHA